MRFLRNALHVARLEGALFRHYPKLRVSVIGILFIPALYAFIYLQSVWDPASHTGNLPAAIVNLDAGTVVKDQRVNVGDELTKTLLDKRAFGFATMRDADAAKREVREGKRLFALIIPADFSESAMSAAKPGAGKLVVYASEGNNYNGAGFAKRFAAELGHQANESLNEKRWAVVMGATSSAADNLSRMREGVAQLKAGAHQLHDGLAKADQGSAKLADGAGQLSTNVVKLTDGVKQLGAGLRTLDAKKPAEADLAALRNGANQLVAGHAELGKGLKQLDEGAGKLAAGAGQMREETKGIPLVGGKVSGGAGQLADGAGQLQSGLKAAIDGQAKLQAGAGQLSQGVTQLTEGFAAYSGAVSLMASKVPADAQLDQLAAGSRTLADAGGQLRGGLGQLQTGAGKLAVGLDTLASSLPAGVDRLPGTAEGLAASVQPELQIDAPVANNGQGFAPNFIPVALWLGAVMTAFIFHLRRLPEAAQAYGRFELLLGKLGILGSITATQALIVWAMAVLVLGIQPVHPAALALTAVVASLTFMLIILGLVRLLGDAGKAVALILLIVQLSSAGGVMPVELTSGFFRAVSPYLPFTWAVRAVRACAFGAYSDAWWQPLGVLALFALGALLVAMLAGRWKFVSPADHRPAMDI